MKSDRRIFLIFQRSWIFICLVLFVFCGTQMGCTSFSRVWNSDVVVRNDSGMSVNLLAIRQLTRLDCGAASLAAVMTYWGENITQEDIKDELGKPQKHGYALVSLRDFAISRGFSAYILSATMDDLKDQCGVGRPCIVTYKTGRKTRHSVVVTKIQPGLSDHYLIVMDPTKGKEISLKEKWFISRWEPLGSPLLLVAKNTKNYQD